MNNTDVVNELLNAASLLEKAASCMEYQNNLQKEAAAAADAMIDRGIGSAKDKENYINYFASNPEKIASTKNFINDLPLSNGQSDLGELVGNSNSSEGLDAFDRLVLGL